MSARQMRRAWERETHRAARRAERSRRKRLIGAAGAALGATVLFAPGAQAASFTVDTLEDGNDGDCLDGDCSLREAVYDANDANGADVVLFDSQLSGTIHLQYGDIEIYDDQAAGDSGGLDIQGPGPGVITVDGEYQNRIFDVGGFYTESTPVRIGGLKLRAGDAERDGGAIRNWSGNGGFAASLTVDNAVLADNYAEDDGGAIFHEEFSLDSLTITNSRITDNRAGYYGGGVYTDGSSVTITGSQINDNVAEHSGGGLFVKYAEGNETTPAVQILDSEINNNRALGLYEYLGPPPAAFGGGAFLGVVLGEVVIERSTIAYNEADPNEDAEVAGGGGIFGAEVIATRISGSTIANNTTPKYGGGVAFFAAGYALVENTTISGNEAGEIGGGVAIAPPVKYARFQNSTITDNDAWHTANGSSGYGGGIYVAGNLEDSPDVELSSTIVAENNDRYDDSPDLAEDSDSVVFELDHSLIGDIGGASYADNGNNIIGGLADPPVDPLLASLSDNGGPTETHLPLAGSPALDAGISNGLTTDQRGEPRTFDLPDVGNVADATDIGSVEIQGPPPPGEQPGATGECKGAQVPLISGTPDPDQLIGTPGSDLIRGAGARDDIDGREGDDCLFGEGDGDVINGDSGDDLASGDDGDDIVSGVQGSDEVLGGAGADRVKGNAGDDTVAGGTENDVVSGGGGQDKVRGQEGNDKVRGAEAADKLSGGAGDDKLKGAGGDDKLKGGAGDDRLNCGAGDDVVKAGPGDKVAENCETVK